MDSVTLVRYAIRFAVGLALFVSSSGQPVHAQVCGDDDWEPAEFCGQDAYASPSNEPEMNHDCHVDILDFGLFAADFGAAGADLSGDFTGDGIVSAPDFILFAPRFGETVPSCSRGGMLPSLLQGTISLSSSSNPVTIEDLATGTSGRVYVVVEDWTDASIMEYAVETSPNVQITDHPTSPQLPDFEPIIGSCDLPDLPAAQQSWRGFVNTHNVPSAWPTGPVVVNYLDYTTDGQPGWIRLAPVPDCLNNSALRWAKDAADRSFCFATVNNVGVNGTAPEGEPGCNLCGDDLWAPAEFCGQDAYSSPSAEPEMNHDCHVDILDFGLFAADFATVGADRSGDLTGDGAVGAPDFIIFQARFGNPVPSCTRGGMLPDRLEGSISLSFNSDPAIIDSTTTQSAGSSGRVYVVADHWTDASIMEYAVETSPNVEITDHPTSPQLPDYEPIIGSCDLPALPDTQRSWRGFVNTHAVPSEWPPGPQIVNTLDYTVADAQPAWIKLVPVPDCLNNAWLRWAKDAANRSFCFKDVSNAGINGPAPVGQSGCAASFPIPVPALGKYGLLILSSALLAIAAVVVARGRRA